MKKPDLDYYRTVVKTQHDPEILKEELQDLIDELQNECSDCKYCYGLKPECGCPSLTPCPNEK